MARRTLPVLAVVALVAGCGGAQRGAASGATGAAAVIRGWAQALARGDTARAGSYFATPSTVQIDLSQPPVVLRSSADARAVNLALPCGATLLDTRAVSGYVDALFLLSIRPGADCGSGAGATARVAFVIGSGKIVVWRRIPDEPGDAARDAPGYQPPSGVPGRLPPTARSV